MRIHSIFVIILITCTTGCGFHLRGKVDLDPKLQTIFISPDDPYEPFQKNLRQLLNHNHIQIKEANNTTVHLILEKQTISEQTLAYDYNGRPYRLLIKFNLQYRLKDNTGKNLHEPMSIDIGREINTSQSERLSMEHERAQILRELHQEAAVQLLYQLSSFHPT